MPVRVTSDFAVPVRVRNDQRKPRKKKMSETDQEETARRNIWTFKYKPAEVLAAAKGRVKHHIKRKEFWNEEYDQAEKQLKEKGFEYRERQSSYEQQVQIVGDPELAQRVTDCRRKIAEHREKLSHYETWVRALEAKVERQPGEELELTIDDVVFFAL